MGCSVSGVIVVPPSCEQVHAVGVVTRRVVVGLGLVALWARRSGGTVPPAGTLPAPVADRPRPLASVGGNHAPRVHHGSSGRRCSYDVCSWLFRRIIACEWSCDTRDSVSPSTVPTSFIVSSSW